MAELIAGIDLGTSNSVITVVIDGVPVVVPDSRGNTIHPSVVAFRPNGDTIVGNDAVGFLSSQPERTVYSSKRLMGRTVGSPDLKILHGSFPFELRGASLGSDQQDAPVRIVIDEVYHPPEGIAARVLKYLNELAVAHIGEPVTKAVITVPANFDEGQRQATMHAGSLAGFEVMQLVNEPTAAALAYGHGKNKRERVAIYDLGGGTFDITILELRNNVYEVLGTAGLSYLGGDDFDLQIVDEIMLEFERSRHVQFNYRNHPVRYPLKSIAQQIKHRLSKEDYVKESINLLIPGTLDHLAFDFSITRNRFIEITRDLVARSLRTCDEALRLANLQTAQIEHLVMVGGSTRVPIVRQKAEQYFHRMSTSDVNPDEVVSVGAAIYGESLVVAPPKKTFSAPPIPKPPARPAPIGNPGLSMFPASPGRPPLPSPRTTGPLPSPPASPSGFGGGSPFSRPPSRPSFPTIPSASFSGSHASDPPDPGFSLDSSSFPPGAPSSFGDPNPHSMTRPPMAPAPETYQPDPVMPAVPLLIDVTPHPLGIETIGGIMDVLIEQNASLPLSRQRTFVASQDNQTEVVIPIYAGNSRKTAENRMLGLIELTNIAPGLREDVQIEVIFDINTSGILVVSATDLRTGKEQTANLSISGVASDDYRQGGTLQRI